MPVVIGCQAAFGVRLDEVSRVNFAAAVDHSTTGWLPGKTAKAGVSVGYKGTRVEPGIGGRPSMVSARFPESPLRKGCQSVS